MDYEMIKATGAIVGGALTFTGAVISFVNSRLNEAKTPQHREVVLGSVRLLITLCLTITGWFLFTYDYFWLGISIFIMLLGTEQIRFLFKYGPMARIDIVVYVLNTLVLCGTIAFMAVGYTFKELIDLDKTMSQQTIALTHVVGTLKDDLARLAKTVDARSDR